MRRIIILLILSLKIFSANQNFYEEYKELINKPDLLSNEQFKKGIDVEKDIVIVTSRYVENVFKDVHIGDTLKNINKKVEEKKLKVLSNESVDLLGDEGRLLHISDNGTMAYLYFKENKLLSIVFTKSKDIVDITINYKNFLLKEYNLIEGKINKNGKYIAAGIKKSDGVWYMIIRTTDFSQKDFVSEEYDILNYEWINENILWKSGYVSWQCLYNAGKKQRQEVEVFMVGFTDLEDIGEDYYTSRDFNTHPNDFFVIKYTEDLKISTAKYTRISDITNWDHPLKKVLKKWNMKVKYVDLIEKNTFPIVTVDFVPMNLSNEVIKEILEANGYWDIRLRDGNTSLRIYGDKKNKKLIKWKYQ